METRPSERQAGEAIRFAVLMFPGFPLMAFSSVIEPLRAANTLSGRRCYSWITVGPDGAKVRASNGIDIELLTGAAITETHWDAFFKFYMDTGSRKWGRPYLTRAFFHRLLETMRGHIALVFAYADGEAVAGAINFIGGDVLYGRQWGALIDIPFLHFEVCYYQAIDFAIARGLRRVEAGTQGEHKLSRGYRPQPVYSAHYIRDPRLRAPVRRFLEAEREAVAGQMAMLSEEASPFRKG